MWFSTRALAKAIFIILHKKKNVKQIEHNREDKKAYLTTLDKLEHGFLIDAWPVIEDIAYGRSAISNSKIILFLNQRLNKSKCRFDKTCFCL